MPSRILRDWTDSLSVAELSPAGERFFVRLIMKADDFGRFHGDDRLLRSALFPLLTDIRQTDVRQWCDECTASGLVRRYQDERGREFLEIVRFQQRTRAKESKFPDPADSPPTNGGHVTVKCQSSAHVVGDGDVYGVGDGVSRERADTKHTHTGAGSVNNGFAEIPSRDEVRLYFERAGMGRQAADNFFDHWVGEHWLGSNGRVVNWQGKAKGWIARDRERNQQRTKMKGDRNDTGF